MTFRKIEEHTFRNIYLSDIAFISIIIAIFIQKVESTQIDLNQWITGSSVIH